MIVELLQAAEAAHHIATTEAASRHLSVERVAAGEGPSARQTVIINKRQNTNDDEVEIAEEHEPEEKRERRPPSPPVAAVARGGQPLPSGMSRPPFIGFGLEKPGVRIWTSLLDRLAACQVALFGIAVILGIWLFIGFLQQYDNPLNLLPSLLEEHRSIAKLPEVLPPNNDPGIAVLALVGNGTIVGIVLLSFVRFIARRHWLGSRW